MLPRRLSRRPRALALSLTLCACLIAAFSSPPRALSASFSVAGPRPDSIYAGPIPPIRFAFELGSIGVAYRAGGGDRTWMDIYRIDAEGQGQIALTVTQDQVNAVQPFGRVAASADQSTAVFVWEDRNVTVAMGGPDNAGKVHFVTLRGGLDGAILETITREQQMAPGAPLANPAGALVDLQMGAGVGGDDCVDSAQSEFSQQAQQIYISASARNLSANATLRSLWYFQGEVRARFDYTPGFFIREYCVWFYLEPSDTEFTPGEWTVELFVNGASQGSARFTITP